eukprot:1180440-Prorocentrum_minimum.AAC.2
MARDPVQVGGAGGEAWARVHTLLARGCGAREEHALLLCSLLLGAPPPLSTRYRNESGQGTLVTAGFR